MLTERRARTAWRPGRETVDAALPRQAATGLWGEPRASHSGGDSGEQALATPAPASCYVPASATRPAGTIERGHHLSRSLTPRGPRGNPRGPGLQGWPRSPLRFPMDPGVLPWGQPAGACLFDSGPCSNVSSSEKPSQTTQVRGQPWALSAPRLLLSRHATTPSAGTKPGKEPCSHGTFSENLHWRGTGARGAP